jgi:drug/metabolite transporter (DMT)-like permease
VSSIASRQHRPVLGVVLKLTSIVLLATMAAFIKYLGPTIPSGETIFVRGIISIVLLAFLAWRGEGLHLLQTRNLRSHALRSTAGTISMFCWFTALTLIPLADFWAITFTSPLFLTVLAMVFLGERIHAFRWTALAVGFAGVLVMVGPHLSAESSSLGFAIALLAAVSSAFAMMFLRGMSGSGGEHAITITFYFSIVTMVCAAFTGLAGWPRPTTEQWVLIVLIGLLGVVGQLLMTYSYRYAEASTIAPLDYTNLLLAVFFGWFFFDELPHVSTWIGAPLVVAAGAIILWREYRLALPRRVPAVTPNV